MGNPKVILTRDYIIGRIENDYRNKRGDPYKEIKVSGGSVTLQNAPYKNLAAFYYQLLTGRVGQYVSEHKKQAQFDFTKGDLSGKP